MDMEYHSLTPHHRDQLGERLRHLATTVGADLAPESVADPAAALSAEADTRTRQDLARMRALHELSRLIDREMATAAYAAGRRGASYADLGAAAGISRQAARTRWPEAIPDARPGRPPLPATTDPVHRAEEDEEDPDHG